MFRNHNKAVIEKGAMENDKEFKLQVNKDAIFDLISSGNI